MTTTPIARRRELARSVEIVAPRADSVFEDMASVRSEFPALTAAPSVAYLDSASTTQKPQQVVDVVTRCLSERTASPGRGGYPWATRLSAEVAQVRRQVARFLGATDPGEIVFTAGATAAMNAVAMGWGMDNLVDGDEILYCPDDHASTVAPWLNLRDVLARAGTTIRLVPYPLTATGEADTDALRAAVGVRTRLIVATHVHPVYGARTTLEELDDLIDPAILRCFDCSQSAGHIPVDVRELRADFAVLAGHKMFAPPGVGVLFCAARTHRQLHAHLPGGAGDGVAADRMPALLEGGTPDVPAILGLGSAVDFIDRVGRERIAAHGTALTRHLVDRLGVVPGVELLRGVAAASCAVGYGIVSLRLPGVRAADVGFVLAAEDIYVRTGGHCLSGADADAIRISLHVYNTRAEVDRACDLIVRITEESGQP